jgi:hypothetical protein
MLLFLIPHESVVSAVLFRVVLRTVVGTSEATVFLVFSGLVANHRLSFVFIFFLNNTDRVGFEMESGLIVKVVSTVVAFRTK